MIILLQRHDDITTKKKEEEKKYVSLLDYREWSSLVSLLHHSWLNIDNMQSANYKAKIHVLLFDILFNTKGNFCTFYKSVRLSLAKRFM